MVLFKCIPNSKTNVQHHIFTFHYGSIQIRSGPGINYNKTIYIPLWFYSNVRTRLESISY